MKLFPLLIFLLISIEGATQDIFEDLFYSTIKLTGYNNKNQSPSTSTAFILSLTAENDTIPIPVLVTNYHSVRNYKNGTIKFHLSLNGKPNLGEVFSVNLKNFDGLWIKHPKEDLAILLIGPLLNYMSLDLKKEIYYRSFPEYSIPTEKQEGELTALEEVFMLGYPKGFSDTLNNLPILRRGTTATPIQINYNKENRFLIDMPVFPGSSGSPVILVRRGGYVDKNGTTHMGNSQAFLLGIASETKEYAAKGSTLKDENGKSFQTITWLPFGIAVVIKSNSLKDFKPVLKKIIQDDTYAKKMRNSFSN